MRPLIISIIALFINYSYGQNSIEFYQKDKTQIKIKAVNDFEKLEITNSSNNSTQVIDSIETSITGREMHLVNEDYNFDGYNDFACYYLDDGMGVYTIYQIFIYNPKNKQFKKLRIPSNSSPKCDEFCDIQLNKKEKTFQSSCRGGARWHTDIWKFDKNENLILLKK